MNNEEVSLAPSEYEPEGQMGDDSDEDDDYGMQHRGGFSSKAPHKKSSAKTKRASGKNSFQNKYSQLLY